MLPSMITQGIIVFQDTSLAYVIGYQEMVRRTTIVDSMEVRSIELYGFVALLFFVVCFVGSRISRHYEEKSRKANIL
jgi:glutamate/aspartate transport system permease protein